MIRPDYILVAERWIPVQYGQWEVREVTYTSRVEVLYGYPRKVVVI